MTQLLLLPIVDEDFERLLAHLVDHGSPAAGERIASLVDALDVLLHSPEIGRPTGDGLRELLIGRGREGYVALYRYDTVLDVVTVLALRHQREAGYVR